MAYIVDDKVTLHYPPYMDDKELTKILKERKFIVNTTDFIHGLFKDYHGRDYYLSYVSSNIRKINYSHYQKKYPILRSQAITNKLIDELQSPIPEIYISKQDSFARDLRYMEYLEFSKEEIDEFMSSFHMYAIPSHFGEIETYFQSVPIVSNYNHHRYFTLFSYYCYEKDMLKTFESRNSYYLRDDRDEIPEFKLVPKYKYLIQNTPEIIPYFLERELPKWW